MTSLAVEEIRPTITLPALPECVSAVREHLRVVLTVWKLPELIDVAVLLGSELATNAIRHAGVGLPFSVVVARDGARVTVAVHDTDRRMPVMREPRWDEPDGRGLMLVDALAADWKAEPTEGGKRVYFVLANEVDAPSGPGDVTTGGWPTGRC